MIKPVRRVAFPTTRFEVFAALFSSACKKTSANAVRIRARTCATHESMDKKNPARIRNLTTKSTKSTKPVYCARPRGVCAPRGHGQADMKLENPEWRARSFPFKRQHEKRHSRLDLGENSYPARLPWRLSPERPAFPSVDFRHLRRTHRVSPGTDACRKAKSDARPQGPGPLRGHPGSSG